MTGTCLAYLMAFISSGTQIANGTKAQNERVSLDIVHGTVNPTYTAELLTFFRIVTTPSSFIIYINRSLDLEHFYEKFNKELSFVQLSLSCGFKTKLSLNLSIEPVNEFPPDLGGPYHACLRMDTPAFAYVFNLSINVCDKDVGGTTHLVYQVQQFQRGTGNGENYLEFASPLEGIIQRNNVTLKYSDYVNLPLHLLYLNMTVQDGAFETWTILVVDVIEESSSRGDVDCSAQRYTATIMETDTNVDVHVQPKLQPCDPHNSIKHCVYSITSGNAINMFAIDNATGELTLLKSVMEVGLTEAFLTLQLQVSKIINCSEETVLAYVAVLTVNINRSRDQTHTTDSGVLSIIIIFGVALVAFIGALSFANIVVCVKDKLKFVHTAEK
ncbi:uncharacterized protein LOC127866344 isoform X2 [Dreissena polymorpha]|uniref:Cadherin domain-containing protein n=1 Tax=Dreissena polymorpha TaxID=45954 RepID=A0A9D4LRQ9_DREPO|nr:uncharacterized protein LOC127866344 isoform X2 [Dreissena polymorpha]KAH3862836.1 hypothetical protein DPMN_025811 [Dreissena polymorpha]